MLIGGRFLAASVAGAEGERRGGVAEARRLPRRSAARPQAAPARPARLHTQPAGGHHTRRMCSNHSSSESAWVLPQYC